MRLDIMTDIETLGTNSDSTIIQISAVAFDIKTGEHIAKFNQIADISKNETPIKVTGATIQWWLKTNKELFAELVNGGEFSSEQVLRNFHTWITELMPLNELNNRNYNTLYLWGNGILFDNKMIQHQLESIGLTYPIFFRNDRDVRTLVELASMKLGITEKELKERFKDDSLVAHNAYDDVVYQINLAVSCFNELTKQPISA
jgi:DNA polymerase III alpha subunit (gram-positive type)